MYRQRHDAGFTLIEVLVVMAVLGIAVAMIAVNLAPDPRQALDTEAQRLALLLQQARDEAMTTGAAIAFSADDRGYRFWQRRRGALQPDDAPGAGWAAHADGEVFRPRPVPPPVTIGELRVHGRPTEGSARRLVFPPSGVAAPFRLALAADGQRTAIVGDALGNIHAE